MTVGNRCTRVCHRLLNLNGSNGDFGAVNARDGAAMPNVLIAGINSGRQIACLVLLYHRRQLKPLRELFEEFGRGGAFFPINLVLCNCLTTSPRRYIWPRRSADEADRSCSRVMPGFVRSSVAVGAFFFAATFLAGSATSAAVFVATRTSTALLHEAHCHMQRSAQ